MAFLSFFTNKVFATSLGGCVRRVHLQYIFNFSRIRKDNFDPQYDSSIQTKARGATPYEVQFFIATHTKNISHEDYS
jgi:hypothetical protein